MQKFFSRLYLTLLCLTPVLVNISGLIVAPIIGIITCVRLLMDEKFDKISKRWYELFYNKKEYLFILLYIFISASWSLSPLVSYFLFLKLAFILFFVFYSNGDEKFSYNVNYTNNILILVQFAMLVIIFEELSLGILHRLVINLLNLETIYSPDDLNRAATIFAVIIWPCSFLAKRSFVRNIMIITCVILTLLSQSLSSITGLIAGIFCSIIGYILPKYITNIVRITTLAIILLIPFIASFMDAGHIAGRFANLPESAKHRLYIWEFTAKKSLEDNLLGKGFGASRAFKVGEDEMIKDMDNKSPFPLHPHNNILQIWFELGIIGLGLLLIMLQTFFTNISQINDTKLKVIYLSTFVSYFTIGLTAYGVWQEWWVATAIYATILLKLCDKNKELEYDKSKLAVSINY